MSIEGGGVLGDAVAARAAGRTGREGSCRPAWSDRHRHGAGPPDPEDPAGRGRASDLRRSGNEEEEIFPDPFSEMMTESWRTGAAKELERQNAALVRLHLLHC